MKIIFFEVSPKDEAYLKDNLSQHETLFVHEPLREDNAHLAAGHAVVSVFIYSTLTAAVLAKMPGVQAIMTRSTGFDHIDTIACGKAGIIVENVPYYGENTVAEHTFALILALSRNVHKSYARGLKNDFSITGLQGFDLKGKTLGVIGTGHVGLHVIRIAKGFGMHVLAYDTHENGFLAEVLHYQYAPLKYVLGQSDIITLHVPGNDKTHHLINQESIHYIRKGALLINTARGGIVENEALRLALDQGILAGAGLDVLEGEELIKEESQCLHSDCQTGEDAFTEHQDIVTRDNVVFTPHIAFYSEEALRRILDTTLENIKTFENGTICNQVPVTHA